MFKVCTFGDFFEWLNLVDLSAKNQFPHLDVFRSQLKALKALLPFESLPFAESLGFRNVSIWLCHKKFDGHCVMECITAASLMWVKKHSKLSNKNIPNFQTSTMLSSEKKTSSTWATVGMSVSWSLVHLLSTRSSRVFQALRGKIGKATNGLRD